MDADVDSDAHASAGPDAKRRKIRKGTHSCWACKRRKEKCTFDPGKAAICIGCQRRGTQCVSQEFPDDLPALASDGTHQIISRVARVETLIETLVTRFDNGEAAVELWPANRNDAGENCHGAPAAASTEPDLGRDPSPYSPPGADRLSSRANATHSLHQNQTTATSGTGLTSSVYRKASSPQKYAKLSQALYKALPSIEDSKIICRVCNHTTIMFNEALTRSYETLENDFGSIESMFARPGPYTHPVLIARYMLRVANILQQFRPIIQDEIQALSESPQEMMDRLADTAISLVTTQDRLLGNLEGLECVMLESMFHANIGSLRLSWAAGRRAMSLAQLMGFHVPESRLQYQMLDPTSKADPRTLWFRIVYYDQYLCLILGLPQGCRDRSMDSDAMLAADSPFGRLERRHCVIASRILERSESELGPQGFALTQELDRDLQKAARSIHSRWWLTPDLGSTEKDDRALFWTLKRLTAHMIHYSMLNKLHLPYMLCKHEGREYSKIACVNASREVLSRFVVLRSFNSAASCCRTTDFLAFMAAMTLVLAHLGSHGCSTQADNLLGHQYHSDRAMMEQVMVSMEEVSRQSGDTLSTESADLLRRLLAIEAEAAEGHTDRAESVSVQARGIGASQNNEDGDADGVVRVEIPYFGVIRIAREGTISKETPKSSQPPVKTTERQTQCSAATAVVDNRTSPHKRSEGTAVPSLRQPDTGRAFATVDNGSGEPAMSTQQQTELLYNIHAPSYNRSFTQPELQHKGGLFDPLLPGLTAGFDDWTFQGVDMAFFDSLIGNNEEAGQFEGASIE